MKEHRIMMTTIVVTIIEIADAVGTCQRIVEHTTMDRRRNIHIVDIEINGPRKHIIREDLF